MKILAIGDLHGKFPNKWANFVRRENVDVVVSNGDYFPFSYAKTWFKHCYHTDKELSDIIGEEKARKGFLNDIKRGESAILKLDKLPVPVFTVLGNHDEGKLSPKMDVTDRISPIENPGDDKYEDYFTPIMNKCKNVKRIDYKFGKVGDYIFIGMNGGSFPGDIDSKAFKRSEKKLIKLFNKFSKENKDKKVILVAHNSPYNTKLDRIGNKAHKEVRGKHYGSFLSRNIIKKFKPVLSLSGHIDEGRGVDKIGKTVCVNVGSLKDGYASLITFNKNGIPQVKFLNEKNL